MSGRRGGHSVRRLAWHRRAGVAVASRLIDRVRPGWLAWLLFVASSAAFGIDMRLPFDGRWFVYQGGDTPNVNHHMAVRAQWFGIDFVKVGGPSRRALSSVAHPKRLEDFYSWDEPVRSPVAGQVVAAVADLPDNAVGAHDGDHPAGNHVIIQAAERWYVFVAHLRRGTLAVKPGEPVGVGQLLGRCGNSGNSDFPHVHLHVQDTLAASATGQNPIFSGIDVELTGKQFKNVRWPLIRGLFVAPSRSNATVE